LARQILEKAKRAKVGFLLPVDCVAATEPKEDAQVRIVDVDHIPADLMGLDVGPKTVKKFADVIRQSKTILWNGPMGVFEVEKYSMGTVALAGKLADATDRGATTIVGGGDTAAAVVKAGVKDRITHISTGGGASLEFLEGKILPGVAALTDAAVKV
jgi:phosphoglycerate kinase